MTNKAFAPAKINLTLHVTGQRADGYHLLDSLVVFADVGDKISVSARKTLSLDITGPMAGGLTADPSNLVLRAAQLFNRPQGALIQLEKHLPIASGIGGGSSDAAASLRALSRLWDQPLPDIKAMLSLGADVPVCALAQACRMAGIGEDLRPIANWPALPAVLVNPGQAVATPSVFKAMTQRDNARMPDRIPVGPSITEAALWLASQRNDMQAAALGLLPGIATVLSEITNARDCLLGRMSGSGATCFGLFPSQRAAQTAAAHIAQCRPQWWVKSAVLQ